MMRRRILLPVIVGFFALLVPQGSPHLSPAEEAAFPYQYRLVQWELANLPGKWYHLLGQVLSRSPDRGERLEQVHRFFRLGDEERGLLDRRNRLAAEEGPKDAQSKQVEEELANTRREREALQPGVEEFLESELSSALREQGILLKVGPFRLQLPPVDFRFHLPPRLLITSPRDRIERLDALLLQPTLTVAEMEALEEGILASQGLSALVEGTGGVATYPAVIPSGHSLRTTLQAAAHEWLHHYFYFKPLGQRYWRGGTLLILNETAADLAGRELGDLVYVRLGGTLPDPEPSPGDAPREEEPPEVFVFEREMRETRLRVDQLLGEERVEEAEVYMEERRQFFLENGVYIRKLNQAYFAFHGSYAESPASMSPVGNEMPELRATFPSVGEFVRAVAAVSSYEEFQALLEERRALVRE